MSDLRADIDAALKRIHEAPWQAYPSALFSPRCGIEDRHGDCQSAICECACHPWGWKLP